MRYEKFKKELCEIDPSKNCFKFLAKRIASDDYRGVQHSQHNRYDMDTIFTMLDELYKIVGTNKMVIRTTDLSKRDSNLPEEKLYADYVTELSKKLGRCTQDSVRKNIFVDLHRMGLIERYDKKGNKKLPYENGTKKYVSISDLGLDFIDNSHSLFERKLRYTRAIDTLTKGLADKLLVIAELDGKISETEFQFFFSFYGEELDGHRYSDQELIEFIQEFRSLSKFPRERAVKLVKEYCNPSLFKGDKTNKRDFRNWLNETQQIFMLMSQTSYYELRDDKLHVRVGENELYENKAKLTRSVNAKKEYFKQHSVTATKGFELHHIVPLCWAKTATEFATLDVWQNLIYIDGYKHSIITHNNNEHVKLDFVGDDMTLTNFLNDTIYCKYQENVLYNPQHKDLLLKYNQDLLYGCGTI